MVDSGVFDTSQGTVHLVLGSGGSGLGRAGQETGTAARWPGLFPAGRADA